MFDADNSLRLTVAGVVLLLGVGFVIAWLPARRRDPAGLPSRVLVTAGLIMGMADLGGLGSVLGFALAAMGAFITWEAQPAPEVPRPHRGGIVVAALLAGVAALGTFEGWGPLTRLPPELRAVATLVVAVTGTLATLAIADRARVRLRVAIKRRFAPPRPWPRIGPVDAGAVTAVGAGAAREPRAVGAGATRDEAAEPARPGVPAKRMPEPQPAPEPGPAPEPQPAPESERAAQPEPRPRSASMAAQSPSRPAGVIRRRFAEPRTRTEPAAPAPAPAPAPDSPSPRGRRLGSPPHQITVAGRSQAQFRNALDRRITATGHEAEPEPAAAARPGAAGHPVRPEPVRTPTTETDAAPAADPSHSKLELRRAVSRRLAASWPDREQLELGPRAAPAPDEPPMPWAGRIRAAFGRTDTARPEPVEDPRARPPSPDPSHVEAAAADQSADDQGGPAWVRARDTLRRLTTSRLEQLDEEPPAKPRADEPDQPQEQGGPAWVRARDALRRLTTSRLEQLDEERPAERRWPPSISAADDAGPRHDAQEVVPWARRDALRRLTVIRLERLDEEAEAGTDGARRRRGGAAAGSGAAEPVTAPTGRTDRDRPVAGPGRDRPTNEQAVTDRRPTPAGAPAGAPAAAPGANGERPGPRDDARAPAGTEPADDTSAPGSSWRGGVCDVVRGRRTRPASGGAPTRSDGGDRAPAGAGPQAPRGTGGAGTPPVRPAATDPANPAAEPKAADRSKAADRPQPTGGARPGRAAAVDRLEPAPPPPPPPSAARRRTPDRADGAPSDTSPPPPPPPSAARRRTPDRADGAPSDTSPPPPPPPSAARRRTPDRADGAPSDTSPPPPPPPPARQEAPDRVARVASETSPPPRPPPPPPPVG